jgi:actin-like ATPase involved in cell morphogenesis
VLWGGGSAGDMAIDLGTANTVVYVRGDGVVLSEPSVVAIDERVEEVYAVGSEAERMIGRTPAAISATRPLRHGVIADFDVTEEMLRRFIAKVVRGRWAHPRLVMCAPSGSRRSSAARWRRPRCRRARARYTSSRSRWLRRSARACRSPSRWGA